MPVVDRVIRAAGTADVRPAAAMFAHAFTADPLYAWVFPDERARRERLPRLFAAQLRAARRGRDEIDLMIAPETSPGPSPRSAGGSPGHGVLSVPR